MRKIEEEMVRAIGRCETWQKGNTRVFCDGLSHSFVVWLYGNEIATGQTSGAGTFRITHATLAGWGTQTTRSRLRALGVDVRALREAEGYIRPRKRALRATA